MVQVSTEKAGRVRIVRLSGELDFFSADELRRGLRRYREEGDVLLLVDLAAVPYVDSSGLGLLIEMQHAFAAAGGRMKLFGVCPEVRRVLSNTDLVHFFDIADSEAAALAGFETPS